MEFAGAAFRVDLRCLVTGREISEGANLDQAEPYCQRDSMGPVGGAKLANRVVGMAIDGALTDPKYLGYFSG